MELKSPQKSTVGNGYNRRATFRTVAQLDADVYLEDITFQGKTLNISSSGLRMIVKGRVLKGESLEMRMRSSVYRGRVRARVVWAAELGPAGFNVVGVAFDDPLPEWDWLVRAG